RRRRPRVRARDFVRRRLARFVDSITGSVVKKVEAVVQRSALAAVTAALDRLDVGGLTISEVIAPSDGRSVRYRGASQRFGAPSSLRTELVATEAYAGPIAWAIATAARSGDPGDGFVTIAPADDAVRIRTGEHGVAALSTRLDPTETADSAAP